MFKIDHDVHVNASLERVWQHVTEVDITAFPHSPLLSLLGIPKPMRAEITSAGAGGARIAYFDNGKRFVQEIISWEPPTYYAFTFQPDPGFRAGHILDLVDGPFSMVSGAYTITAVPSGANLNLTSAYQLRGFGGRALALPVRLTLHWFQNYLLQGIKANAERDHA